MTDVITTVVIVDRGKQFDAKVKYARNLTEAGRIFIFDHTKGLVSLTEKFPRDRFGDEWFLHVASRFDEEIVKHGWSVPIEIVLLTDDPAIEIFLSHFDRSGLLSYPLAGLSPSEVDSWLTVRA